MGLGFYSKILGAAALLAVSALPFAPAQAADPAQGTYYGTGNPGGEWTITTGGGIELGLRAVYRYGAVIVPDSPGTYTASTGGTSCIHGTLTCGLWNYNFSIDTLSSGLHLSDLVANLSITGPSGSTTVAVLSILDNNGDGISGNGPTGSNGGHPLNAAQNSENLAFGAEGLPGYNPWLAGTYTFNLNVSTVDGPVLASSSMTVNAVPEPASMALLGAGLAGLGLIRRRRRA